MPPAPVGTDLEAPGERAGQGADLLPPAAEAAFNKGHGHRRDVRVPPTWGRCRAHVEPLGTEPSTWRKVEVLEGAHSSPAESGPALPGAREGSGDLRANEAGALTGLGETAPGGERAARAARSPWWKRAGAPTPGRRSQGGRTLEAEGETQGVGITQPLLRKPICSLIWL